MNLKETPRWILNSCAVMLRLGPEPIPFFNKRIVLLITHCLWWKQKQWRERAARKSQNYSDNKIKRTCLFGTKHLACEIFLLISFFSSFFVLLFCFVTGTLLIWKLSVKLNLNGNEKKEGKFPTRRNRRKAKPGQTWLVWRIESQTLVLDSSH